MQMLSHRISLNPQTHAKGAFNVIGCGSYWSGSPRYVQRRHRVFTAKTDMGVHRLEDAPRATALRGLVEVSQPETRRMRSPDRYIWDGFIGGQGSGELTKVRVMEAPLICPNIPDLDCFDLARPQAPFTMHMHVSTGLGLDELECSSNEQGT
ncbi:hypothetical protein CORC01_09427 [Colletotrichum orchidophilum]|uniref:Uncharacterized protein n=1 Tax=Colletotrichum orchidophilum TaxID=1209926 RepID=A0A1G4B1U7_9PEZI|nr:uncharacterized protein CORC01_09427 [Colletotrichum orchidophilum]OHE95282.1 hypothetical protein CORC01_09427 [Colletotrichum orchidophilum]